MSKYDLEINYLHRGFDISGEELSEIIVEADKVIAENTEDPEKTAEAYLKKSQFLQKMGKYEESNEPVQKALALFPDMVEAVVQLGNIYHKEKKYDDALAAYNRAIQINPGYVAAFTNRGNVYSSNGEPEKAIADYSEAIRLKPDNAIAFINRSRRYGETGEYDRAERDEDEAVRLQPGLKLALPHLYDNGWTRFPSMSILGDDKERKKVNEEIRTLTMAISLQPDRVNLFNNRAHNYIMLGEYDKAIADWTEAIRLGPENERWMVEMFYQSRGEAYSKKGDYEKAIADYTESIRLAPENSGANKKRGDAYKALGQHDRAAFDHEKANQLKQSFRTKCPENDIVDLVEDLPDISEIFNENIDTGRPEKLVEAYLKKSLHWFSNHDEQQSKEFLAKVLDIYSGMNEEKAKQLKSAFLSTHVADKFRKLDNKITRRSNAISKQPEKAGRLLNNRGIAYAEKAAYGKALWN